MQQAVALREKQEAQEKSLKLQNELTDITAIYKQTQELYESKIRSIVRINQLLEAKLFKENIDQS